MIVKLLYLQENPIFFFCSGYRFFLRDKFVVLNDKNPLILHFPHHCIHTLYMLNMQSRYINSPDFANKASQLYQPHFIHSLSMHPKSLQTQGQRS